MKEKPLNSFEKLLQDKIESLDFEYNPTNWNRLESDLDSRILPKTKPLFLKVLPWAASFIILAALVSSVVYFNSNRDSEPLAIADSVAVKIQELPNEKIINSDESNSKELEESMVIDVQSNEKSNPEQINQVHRESTSIGNKIRNEDDFSEENDSPSDEEKPVTELKENQNLIVEKVPDARFSFSLENGCAPLLVQFYPIELSDTIEYYWLTSDGQVSHQQVASFTFNEPGNFRVSLRANYMNSSNYNYFEPKSNIMVYPTPEAEFTVLKDEFYYSFTPVEAMLGNTFDWNIDHEVFQNRYQLENHFIKNGKFLIRLKVTNDSGCEDEHEEIIEVEVFHPVYIGNAFTPDGDGENDFFGPAAQYLNDLDYTMEIYNRNGGLVFKTMDPNHHWDGIIMGSNQAAMEGFYIWKIYTSDQHGNKQEKIGDVFLFRNK